jgi:hypothetical protein
MSGLLALVTSPNIFSAWNRTSVGKRPRPRRKCIAGIQFARIALFTVTGSPELTDAAD